METIEELKIENQNFKESNKILSDKYKFINEMYDRQIKTSQMLVECLQILTQKHEGEKKE